MRDLYLDPTGRYVVVSLYGRGAWELDLGAPAPSSNGPGKNGAPSAGGSDEGAVIRGPLRAALFGTPSA